uniref:Ig-like domain-containing protein n=1 Tax=Sinocyclocheilus rhinocerous TaxID=307959 RepID=A0A673G707_9TELE
MEICIYLHSLHTSLIIGVMFKSYVKIVLFFSSLFASQQGVCLVVHSTTPEFSLGSDLIIPCHLSPEISAVDMEISWSNDTARVCLNKDRQVTEGVLFKDRASSFTHKLREGNVSLQLKNFRLSDIGNYHCQVISKDRREKITVRSELCIYLHLI